MNSEADIANKETELNETIRLVRICFHRLAALGDQLHGEQGISAAMRGVMESLFTSGNQTVPHIAASKSVSRQHIQKLADALAERDLVRFEQNPGHKRSSLLSLTAAGQRAFRKMLERERVVLHELTSAMGDRAIADTNATLRSLEAELARGTPGSP